MNNGSDVFYLGISKRTRAYFRLREFSVIVSGNEIGRIRTLEQTLEVNYVPKCTLKVISGFRKSNVLKIEPPKNGHLDIAIENKEITMKKRSLLLVIWGLCISLGFILFPGMGAVIGFWVGYVIKSLCSNDLHIRVISTED